MATAASSSTARGPLRPRVDKQAQAVAWIAWSSCAVYWVAISTGYALELWHGTAPPAGNELGWRIGFGGFATVGAVIAARRPHNSIG
jgi:hypothetical protein